MRAHVRTLGLALALAAVAGCDTGQDAPAATAQETPLESAPTPTPAPVPGPQAGPAVPAPFLGRYALDADACAEPGDPTRLEITGDRISFHESSGPVLRADGGPAGLAITAELTGEGETREATYRFGLSGDGSRLTDLDGGLERVRCE